MDNLLFSISEKTVWLDFIVLITSLILINIGTKLLSPTTEFLITYGDEFNKIYAGILTIFPIFQLITVFIENNTFSKKTYLKIFILTIIVSLLILGGIEIYGKTIDLKKLSDTEKIYLYSYRKYTPELINFAIYEIENGNSISKKGALIYIGKNDKVIKENSDVLEKIIFNKNPNSNIDERVEYQGAEFEDKLYLMIKINPEKTLVFAKNQIADNDINKNLTTIDILRRIVITSPELLKEGCEVAEEVVKTENARSEARNITFKDSDLIRLEKYLRDLPEKCGKLGIPLKIVYEQEDCVVMKEKYIDYNADLCKQTSVWSSPGEGKPYVTSYTEKSDKRCPTILTEEEMEVRKKDFQNQCLSN